MTHLRLPLALALALAAWLAPVGAGAAPIDRVVEMRLTAFVPGTGGFSFNATAATTVSVDEATESLVIPPHVFGGINQISVAVSSTTAIDVVSVKDLDLLGGTLRPGGITTQLPGELCPPAPVPSGVACNGGGGLGGAMPLTGTFNVTIIAPVVIAVPLGPHVGGGGSTNDPFIVDGAGWTIGNAIAATPLGQFGTYRSFGLGADVDGTLDVPASRLSLVVPAFVAGLGNQLVPGLLRPWRLQIDFLDGLGIPQFIIDAFDEDRDGLVRSADNCPEVANPGQEDADTDGIGDACDLECDDGLDNDSDGLIDFPDDPGCPIANLDDESPPCADGLDNDSDGDTDFPADAGCANVTSEEDPACQDGVDNDLDGDVDHPADAGCAAASALSEEPECSDGLDNDSDGDVDLADLGCRDAAWFTESPQCSDGVNNDPSQDALVDFPADPDCTAAWDESEWPETGCGLGGEVAVLLLGLLTLRRGRRHPAARHG